MPGCATAEMVDLRERLRVVWQANGPRSGPPSRRTHPRRVPLHRNLSTGAEEDTMTACSAPASAGDNGEVLPIDTEREGCGVRRQNVAGPRNHPKANGLLGSEEAVGLYAAGNDRATPGRAAQPKSARCEGHVRWRSAIRAGKVRGVRRSRNPDNARAWRLNGYDKARLLCAFGRLRFADITSERTTSYGLAREACGSGPVGDIRRGVCNRPQAARSETMSRGAPSSSLRTSPTVLEKTRRGAITRLTGLAIRRTLHCLLGTQVSASKNFGGRK